MFNSIRWRLVASYVLLTLLVVVAVGLVSLEIVRRITRQQEIEALQANASAIAEQVLPLMWPGASVNKLEDIAQAASFLGDARVRILDRTGQTLADSGSPAFAEKLIFVLPSGQVGGIDAQTKGWFSLQVYTQVESLPFEAEDPLQLELRAASGEWPLLRKYYSPWGGRLVFSDIRSSGDQRVQIEPIAEETPPARSTSLVRQPIGESGNPLGYVELSAGPDFGAAALATARGAFIIAGVGATFLAMIVGLVMSQRLTSPMRQLGETAVQMGTGDLSARAQVQSQDEIGALAAHFNSMADQLEGSFLQLKSERDSLRRFIADASHELRTPVTALKNYLTLLQGSQGSASMDRRIKAEFLAESQAQVDRLEWITRNLLDLTRLDAGLVEMDYGVHDLSEVMAGAAASIKLLADAKKLRIKVNTPDDPISLRCDRPRLELALANLLDNAVKFSPAGELIEIGAEQKENVTRTWVEDDGPGIHPDDLPHVFERFYRGRGQTGEGSGLGLAIVKSLVEAQGGQVSVESEVGKGTRVTLVWPVTTST